MTPPTAKNKNKLISMDMEIVFVWLATACVFMHVNLNSLAIFKQLFHHLILFLY